MEKIVLIYVTCSNQEEALKIGRMLLEDRLVACVNIYPEIKSLYWWEDKLNEDREAVLILKTRDQLAEEVINKIKEIHSYTCPCILVMPIKEGFRPFFDWILKETKEN